MTNQSGGGTSLPGVTPDGLTPPGLILDGGINQTASLASLDSPVSVLNFLRGTVQIDDMLGMYVEGRRMVDIAQHHAVPANDQAGPAFVVGRNGDISAGDYGDVTAEIMDFTASSETVLVVYKAQGTGLALDILGRARFSGVIGEHGKAPALDPTAITGTITSATLPQLTAIVLQLLQALDAKGSITNSTT